MMNAACWFAFAMVVVFACVPPSGQAGQQTGYQQGGGTAQPEGQPGATPGSDLCNAACQRFQECGARETMDECQASCPNISEDRLQRFANSTCEQLHQMGGGGRQIGAACIQGSENCNEGLMCCTPSGPAGTGGHGNCAAPAACMLRQH